MAATTLNNAVGAEGTLGKQSFTIFEKAIIMKQLIFILCILSTFAVNGQALSSEKNTTEQEVYKGAAVASNTDVPTRGSIVLPVSRLMLNQPDNSGVFLASHRHNIGEPSMIVGAVVIGVSAVVLGVNYDENSKSRKSKLSESQENTWVFVAVSGFVITSLGLVIDQVSNAGWFIRNFTAVRGSNQVGIAYCFK